LACASVSLRLIITVSRTSLHSVKAHVGMEPHTKTPPPPVLYPEVTATQVLELLASVSARTHDVSGTEFVVEPVSTPQPQALNRNLSIV